MRYITRQQIVSILQLQLICLKEEKRIINLNPYCKGTFVIIRTCSTLSSVSTWLDRTTQSTLPKYCKNTSFIHLKYQQYDMVGTLPYNYWVTRNVQMDQEQTNGKPSFSCLLVIILRLVHLISNKGIDTISQSFIIVVKSCCYCC